MIDYLFDRPLLVLALVVLALASLAIGGTYVALDMKQSALARQGIHMSKWDILVLSPQVRVVNGQVQQGD